MRSKWSEIGDDVLCLILQRLCPIDYLRTQTVCLNWQSTISRFITNKHGPPSPELPLVLLNTHETYRFSFFNLSTKSVFSYIADSSSSTFKSQIICYGTVQGWMIMVEAFKSYLSRRRVFFFNPVTKTKVYMRSRLGNQYNDFKRFIASAKPTDPNCVVVCLFRHTSNSFAFSFMSDKSWTKVEGDEERKGINFVQAEILDGKLYALTDERLNCIIVCDLRKKPVKPQVLAKLPAATIRVPVTLEVDDRFPFSVVFNSHGEVLKSLAIDASSGELLLVYVFHNSKYSFYSFHISPPNITGSKVFKLDNFMSSKPKWIEVKNLKNRMLFVDNKRSLVVSNIYVHGPKELIEENCIYFAYKFLCEIITMEPSWEGMRIGRHCRSNGRTSYYKFERSDPVNVSSPIWFIPRLDE